MYDVFISYRREGGYAMARLLYEHFQRMGLNPFFDLEELKSGHFDTKIYKSIDESKNIVVVLPPNSLDRCKNEDDWLRLEIEHAITKKKNIIPVLMSGFEMPSGLTGIMKEFPTYNGVRVSREYFDASISRIAEMLVNVNINQEPDHNNNQPTSVERVENPYFKPDDEKEKRRLKIQQNLMKSFDAAAYEKVAKSFEELYILDIGSNNGDFIMDRIGNRENVRLLVGLEYDPETVIVANKKHGVEGKIAFYEQNVEAEDLTDKITEILESFGVERFNVISISMVLLHLKTPYRLLKALRGFLEKGGMIIIKDIDDGLNLAYPDEDGEFERIFDICAREKYSGYRYSGRQVYTLLKRSGYNEITLEKMGLSTVNMDYDDRSALFDIYFSFILEDLKLMLERYPDDRRILDDYNWYKSNYESFEEQFLDESFFFNLGFVIFTAKKR